jgi:hypothetical protein
LYSDFLLLLSIWLLDVLKALNQLRPSQSVTIVGTPDDIFFPFVTPSHVTLNVTKFNPNQYNISKAKSHLVFSLDFISPPVKYQGQVDFIYFHFSCDLV